MVSRRLFLGAPAALASRGRVTREVFLPSPGKGTAVLAHAWYTSRKGLALTSVEKRLSRSDTVDAAWFRHSRDNGRIWSAPDPWRTSEKVAGGTWRVHPHGGFVDPHTGRYLEFRTQGVLPHDNPLEGMQQWNIFYRSDGGEWRQIVHEGAEFDAGHPLPGVWTGRNMVMLGEVTCVPYSARDGSILLPAMITSLGPDGKVYNPTGGYTYTDALVLHARWRNGRLQWRAAEPVKGDPARSTRGMDEPTIDHLADGRLIMLLRGANDRNYSLPAYRWVSYSDDGGWKWTEPQPWTFDDGQAFFSPSAASQLLRHSSGRLFWIGHIAAGNARGNRPRYPVYLGEVDQQSGALKRDSLIRIDDRQPGEDEILMLYPPYAREDRRTREVVIHMSRIFAFPSGFEGDAMLYRVTV
jgi:hypothetical protein